MSTRVGVPRSSDRHVEVWFGAHVIAAFTGSTEDAAPYEAGMELRFPGLPITNKPVPAVVDSGTADS
ncbi:hypothetical protein F1D05_10425 [Kribbella qitaiheensis]|uniref:Uncharacterized protein n=1 Tax=Kribbella qitaiheensis TaxID=1544730 RepID=A0A7G6X9F2_9ACTN|nr:hypothetical protein F1D05_10425 [Kribbella qitaiheensis]